MLNIIIKIYNVIYTAFKTFGIFHGLRKILITSVYKRLSDPVMADYVYAKSSYCYVKYFFNKHNGKDYVFNKPVNDIDKNKCIYWTCWLQGIESAPAIVKACINSAKKFIEERERIIIITYENFDEYISLPKFIIKKHKQGYISPAHFSDILRTYLLYTYGGVWFDATVFFTRKIPVELLSEPLFFFRGSFDEIAPVSNWFIIANTRGNPLLFKQLCLLYEFWRVKNTLIDYFIFHYFLWAIIQNDPQCARIFANMAYRNSQDPHYLQKELLFSYFDEEKWRKVESVSFCHKLTYKVPGKISGKISELTFYQYLIDNFSQN
jgi:hypothetical protein